MKQLFEGITNQQLLVFTELFGSYLQDQRPTATFDTKITDSNRKALMAQAERDAKAYAESRNRNTQPKSLTGLDQSLVASVKAWANHRKAHLRGKK